MWSRSAHRHRRSRIDRSNVSHVQAVLAALLFVNRRRGPHIPIMPRALRATRPLYRPYRARAPGLHYHRALKAHRVLSNERSSVTLATAFHRLMHGAASVRCGSRVLLKAMPL
ncbi:unnamed protein product [Colias eurytheme]|nr:unnamed protein product [Colias eurytheme]